MPPTPLKSQNYIGGTYLTPNTENRPHAQHRYLASIPVFVYIMHWKTSINVEIYIQDRLLMKWSMKSDSQIENIAIEFYSAEFAFYQSRGDEVFEKTKGCADKMSTCAAS